MSSDLHPDIQLASFADFLKSLPAGGVDCVVTDPAYWTLDKWREIGTTTRLGGHRNADKRDESQWFPTITPEDLRTLICECSRILPKSGHCWIMGDTETLGYILGYAREDYRKDGRSGHLFGYYKSYPVLKRAKSGGYRQIPAGHRLSWARRARICGAA